VRLVRRGDGLTCRVDGRAVAGACWLLLFRAGARRAPDGSLIDELQRREAAARAEAEELRGRIAELAECLAGVEERLSRLVITREMVDEVLSEAGAGVRRLRSRR
jgi:hypothetical protein